MAFLPEHILNQIAESIDRYFKEREIIKVLDEVNYSSECGRFLIDKENHYKGSSKFERMRNLLLEIEECLFEELLKTFYKYNKDFLTPQIVKLLDDEGFDIKSITIDEDELIPDFSLKEKISSLEEKLETSGYKLSLYHLKEAIKSYSAGSYASATSQIRTLFEAFFEELMKDLGNNCRGGKCRKEFIENILPKIETSPEEIGKYNNLLRAVSEILHSKGSHPGIAEKELFYFRLLLVLSWIFYSIHIRDRVRNGNK